MKVFISADIEGTAGIAHWNEAERIQSDYADFRALMTVALAEAGFHSSGSSGEGARSPGSSPRD